MPIYCSMTICSTSLTNMIPQDSKSALSDPDCLYIRLNDMANAVEE